MILSLLLNEKQLGKMYAKFVSVNMLKVIIVLIKIAILNARS
jgi:hypothetical protein